MGRLQRKGLHLLLLVVQNTMLRFELDQGHLRLKLENYLMEYF